MKTEVAAIKVVRPDELGSNWIQIRTPDGQLKRKFLEKLLRDGVVVPSSAVLSLLAEMMQENHRLRKEIRLQRERIRIRDEIIAEQMVHIRIGSGMSCCDVESAQNDDDGLDENGVVKDYYGT